MKKNICVLISGSGSNCQAIIDAVNSGDLNAKITRIIADRDCSGKNRAYQHDIPFAIIDRKLPKTEFADTLAAAIPNDTHLIVLAGFLSIIPAPLITQYPNQIINIHPSLLPKFGGMGMHGLNVHQAVIDAKESESGCTVHYVNEDVDTGGIIAQEKVSVKPTDSASDLQQRIIVKEHQLLVSTIRSLTD